MAKQAHKGMIIVMMHLVSLLLGSPLLSLSPCSFVACKISPWIARGKVNKRGTTVHIYTVIMGEHLLPHLLLSLLCVQVCLVSFFSRYHRNEGFKDLILVKRVSREQVFYM